MKRISFVFAFFISALSLFSEDNVLDLSGKWQFLIDRENSFFVDGRFSGSFEDVVIDLPGTTDEAGFGKAFQPGNKLYDGKDEIWRLARRHTYIGPAWYQRTFSLPKDWKGNRIELFLERCMWSSAVWVNGIYAGGAESLSTAHRINISSYLKSGENSILLRIDNSPQLNLGSWSHGYSEEVQSIWNGVVGRIELVSTPPQSISSLYIYSCDDNSNLFARFKIDNYLGSADISYRITKLGSDIAVLSGIANASAVDGFYSFQVNVDGKLDKWSDRNPALYTLSFSVLGKDGAIIKGGGDFGLRSLIVKDSDFFLNGTKVFLRGEHEAGLFPLTGYPSMKKNEWKRIFQIGKNCGFNHWRFHSWCPPEAAFSAADEIGILLQPELPLFSQKWEGSLIGTSTRRDDFLFNELKQILNDYGSHPSFVLMCMGNELKGNPKVLNDWVAWGQRNYPGKLYASSSNLEAMALYNKLSNDQFQIAHAYRSKGIRGERRMNNLFNKERPNTSSDYSASVSSDVVSWPVISHEVGQWMVYPDFNEVDKYSGVFVPRNFLIYKDKLTEAGMLDQANDFYRATTAFSLILYKEEIERLLRTPGMDGFQLLDLRDYPGQGSAHIGLFNSFWEPKIGVHPEKIRESCNEMPLFLKMPKRSWLNNETFCADLVIPNYAGEDRDTVVSWSFEYNGQVFTEGKIDASGLLSGDVNTVGQINVKLGGIKRASMCSIKLKDEKYGISNSYDVWIFPKIYSSAKGNVIVTRILTSSIKRKLREGAKVLLLSDSFGDTESIRFSLPFWSTILFNYQPKSMGIFCDSKHPIFGEFPTQFHSNWQWWDLTRNAKALRLNFMPEGYRPLLQVIDHPSRNDKLGCIVETSVGKGSLVVCTLDLNSKRGYRPEAQQLKYSILKYMNSDEFKPDYFPELEKMLFNEVSGSPVEYDLIECSTTDRLFPVENAFDGSFKSWRSKENARVVIRLKKSQRLTGCAIDPVIGCLRPGTFKVYVTVNLDNPGSVVISGDFSKSLIFEAVEWDNGFTVQKGKQGLFLIIEMDKRSIKSSAFKIKEFKLFFQ